MKPLNSKLLPGLLLITNIITAGFLYHSKNNSAEKTIIFAGGDQQNKPAYSYRDNPQYVERMSFYPVYSKKGNIVMLGNSITARIDWTELMNRNDIINRGIGSDITEGFLSRMEYIWSVNPKVCYIMGGVNDIGRNIPLEETVQNINKIIEGLKQHKIIPVLQSVLYVADTYPGYVEMNRKIELLNSELEKTAKENDIIFLNLNSILSSDKQLIREYALKDGIHLNGSGYVQWRKVFTASLKELGI